MLFRSFVFAFNNTTGKWRLQMSPLCIAERFRTAPFSITEDSGLLLAEVLTVPKSLRLKTDLLSIAKVSDAEIKKMYCRCQCLRNLLRNYLFKTKKHYENGYGDSDRSGLVIMLFCLGTMDGHCSTT